MKRAGSIVPGVLTVWLLGPVAAVGEDWPQWRGPGRDGRAAESGEGLGWGEDGPRRIWRREAGPGFSPVAAAGDRLFTAWAEGEETVVVALDAATGALVWRTPIGTVFRNERGGGPRSTPTVDDDRLYLMSGRGRLVALELAGGRTLWQRDLVGELGAETPIWGFAASPLVVGDRVVVPVGGDGQAVAAFARDDGRLLWSAHDDAIGYSSPVLAELAGRPQIVALTGQSVSGLSVEGELLWTYPWPVINNISVATPLAVGGDRVFVSTSYDVGAVLLEITADETGMRSRELWRDRVMKNHFQDSVLHEDHLYGFDNAVLKCIRVATGEERWRHRGLGKGQLVLAGGRLLLLGERGRLVLAEASPRRYVELAAADLPSQRYWTPPSLVDGRLFVRTEREVFALDLRQTPGAAVAAAAEDASRAGAEPTVEELIRRNLAARGPDRAWEGAGTVRLRGRFNRNGRESRMTAWRQGEKVRFEIVFGELRELFVYDGVRGWFQPLRERGAPVPGERLPHLLAQADTWLPRRDPWSALEAIEWLGRGGEAGETYDRLRVVDRGWPQEWRLSVATGLLAEALRGVGEGGFDSFMTDYRPVEGRLYPHYVEASFGTGLYSLTVEEIVVVPGPAEGLFEVSAEPSGTSAW